MKFIYLPSLLLLLCGASLQAQEFVNEILIPPIINDDNYHLNVIETQHNFNPSGTDSLNTMVKTFAFEDANNPGTTTILGPTLTWGYLKDLTPTVTNNLTEVTTCHWHGAHVPQFA
ncbi:MAG: multicopper oxidase domain-containing protein, partial [Bacteroidota bacterium]